MTEASASALRTIRVSLCVALTVAAACTTRSNFVDPAGPRYASDYGVRAQTPAGPSGGTLRVVSYNVKYGDDIDGAIAVLTGTPALAAACPKFRAAS